MATFEEICKQDITYHCDKCKETFKAKEIKLKAAATNIEIPTSVPSMVFVDKNGIIKGGGTLAIEGDRVLVCPKCGELHLYGFNTV